ncbi:MAG: hypothetical protein RRZ24_11405, partial [Clostridia bacterium]
IEQNSAGTVNVWLCRQVDTYVTEDGIREYDVDVRVVYGIDKTPGLEADIRMRFEAWWDAAVKEG